ncbi:FkbM family methyltransferase [Aphanizomenon sp. PH219]|nr:FkbM family methyltransferase [Aphanizomenon sp. 202]MDK2462316.1 FkbM family methyltransferase [Aphanizomenon sp. PH219]
MLEYVGMKILDTWGKIGIAPGWHYQTIENFSLMLKTPFYVTGILPNGCFISCNLKDHVQSQIYFLGVYEPIESYLFTKMLKPGMTVIDAGANVGQYSLLASNLVGANGSVHSFEPVPKTFAILNNNVVNNKISNIYLNQAALWNESKRIKLSLDKQMSDNIGSYTMGINDSFTEEVESISISLDEYVASKSIKKVDLIKMDIEGAEFCALLGMKGMIERDYPIILAEINRIALQKLGYNPEEIWVLLTNKFGYNGYLIDNGCFQELSDVFQINQKNIVFIHRSVNHNFIKENWDYKAVLRWARRGKK